jgi:OmpA-OmpF porin, OOP family
MFVQWSLVVFYQFKSAEGPMKSRRTLQVTGLLLALFLTMGVGFANAADRCPDNFIFAVDQSGSMYQLFGDPELKMWVSKKVLYDINAQIPDLKYTAALELFAPVEELYAPGPYDREAMSKAIGKIKNFQEVFDRRTPMGPGLRSLDPVLAKMSGTTAIILVTDGMANMGSDPVAEASALYSKYPNICIHIVSVADTKDKKGKQILQKINKLNNCSIMVEGLTLTADRAALEKFVRDVFCAPLKPVGCSNLILRGIHFDFDKYNIKKEWVVVLDEAVRRLNEEPCLRVNVIIEGHTDYFGSDNYNQKLSERRAGAVYNYFLKKGIKAERMRPVGYGENRPKTADRSPAGRAINRRVEITVVE